MLTFHARAIGIGCGFELDEDEAGQELPINR
jgi:hypothetical protein